MDPVQHDVIIYSDSMSCLQAIESENTDSPLICQIINLLWALSDKGTHIRFCWVPSHCGIEGNELVDQLAKETLDHDIDPLTTVHFADLKPLVNSYIQQEFQIKWDVSIQRSVSPEINTRTTPRFWHLTRAEVVITRLLIGHTKATKSHILSQGPSTACQHCGQTDHWTHIPGMYRVSTKSWWVLNNCPIEDPLWDDPRGLHNSLTVYSKQLFFFKSVTNWRHSQVEFIPTT